MPPKKHAQAGEGTPLEEEPRPASPEHQATLDDILELLRAQTTEIHTLHERIQELENDRSTTPS